MTDELNGLDNRINDRGFFERILRERENIEAQRQKTLDERFARVEDRFEEQDKALQLQAEEYSRRLTALNGEYQRDIQRQSQYVTVDKWETTNEAERVARIAALLRVDEKFEEYGKRYEVRQREVDILLAAQAGAAEEAKRAVEEAVRRSDAQARDLSRKQSRNLGLASLGLGLVVFVANVIPFLTGH